MMKTTFFPTKKSLLALTCACLPLAALQAVGPQPLSGRPIEIPEYTPGMQWFEDAKLGIFLHWGIYAVGQQGESHNMNHPDPGITPEAYYNFAKKFGAENYDPAEWAETFRKAGAKYAILTTKHHDGFALWDTRAPDGFDAVNDAPAGRDLIALFVEGMRAGGIRPGFYFSLADWHHPDYASISSGLIRSNSHKDKPMSYSETDDPERWAKFLVFMNRQVDELAEYKPDIWWFDGGWERTPETWQSEPLARRLMEKTPDAIFGRTSFRVPGGHSYTTPEQGLPITTVEGPWELCMTTDEFWAYRPRHRKQLKSAPVLVRMFAEVIGSGGNLLLNIAPGPDGTLPPDVLEPILTMGEWIHRHSEAIYGTVGGERVGISYKRFLGPSTVTRDGKTLYLFLHDIPRDVIMLRSLISTPTRAVVLHSGEELQVEQLPGNREYPGHFVIHAPTDNDPLTTIVKLEFDEVIQLGSDRPKHRQ